MQSYLQIISLLAKYPSVGRVSAMVLCCHVQSHKTNAIKTDLSAGTPHGISRIPQRFSGR